MRWISPVALTCTGIFDLLSNFCLFMSYNNLATLSAPSRCTCTEVDATRSTSKLSQSKHSHTTFVNIDATIQVNPPLLPLPLPSPPREPLEIIRTGATERVIKKMAILRTHSAPPITVIRPADALTLQEMTTISIELFLPAQHCSHDDPPPALHPHQRKSILMSSHQHAYRMTGGVMALCLRVEAVVALLLPEFNVPLWARKQ